MHVSSVVFSFFFTARAAKAILLGKKKKAMKYRCIKEEERLKQRLFLRFYFWYFLTVNVSYNTLTVNYIKQKIFLPVLNIRQTELLLTF